MFALFDGIIDPRDNVAHEFVVQNRAARFRDLQMRVVVVVRQVACVP